MMTRRAQRLLLTSLAVACLALLGWYFDRRGPELAGSARAIDGDSLAVDGAQVRLYGIDAPEHRQTCMRDGEPWACGVEATRTLQAILAGHRLVCRVREEDRFGRAVAVCHAGAVDVGAEMVKRGLAVAYGAYRGDEREAREARRGIWSSSFERPAEWRARHPRPAERSDRR